MDSLFFAIFHIVVLIYSVVIHEVAHGVVANSMGDTTARDMGRLTLNPLKHLDMFGSFILPLFLYLTTHMAIGYAKPVPYNPYHLDDRKFGPAKVAFAGPASNLILALLFGLLLRFLPDIFTSPLMPSLIQSIILINLGLAVFNLFPVPPLDGHWLLMAFLPARFMRVRAFLYRYNLPLLVVVVMFIFPPAFSLVLNVFSLVTGISFGGI
jgi:Zn-dependent protease